MILMQQCFNSIEYLVGDGSMLNTIEEVPALPIFSDRVLEFFDQLSKKLMHNARAKGFPDVISYAFWIRKGHMEMSRKRYVSSVQKIGRGVVFHVAPSNIPVQFAVSMTYALLAGNASVVRISNKAFEQTNIICENIIELINSSFSDIKKYICIIRYGHDDEITQAISDICDVRMIWGGDKTISAIRKTNIPARCIDLGFADRYSLAVFDADALLNGNLDVIANAFYNDTYFVDQNACSSPRIVVWLGERVSEARTSFWKALEKLVLMKYAMDPICSSEKLLNSAVVASTHPDALQIKNNNLLVRMEVQSLQDDIMKHKGNCGYFFEYEARDIEEIVPLMKKECQTVVFIGKEIQKGVRNLIYKYGVRGVDRIVPVGHGADISFVWDGLDLPNILSREISDS